MRSLSSGFLLTIGMQPRDWIIAPSLRIYVYVSHSSKAPPGNMAQTDKIGLGNYKHGAQTDYLESASEINAPTAPIRLNSELTITMTKLLLVSILVMAVAALSNAQMLQPAYYFGGQMGPPRGPYLGGPGGFGPQFGGPMGPSGGTPNWQQITQQVMSMDRFLDNMQRTSNQQYPGQFNSNMNPNMFQHGSLRNPNQNPAPRYPMP